MSIKPKAVTANSTTGPQAEIDKLDKSGAFEVLLGIGTIFLYTCIAFGTCDKVERTPNLQPNEYDLIFTLLGAVGVIVVIACSKLLIISGIRSISLAQAKQVDLDKNR